MANLSFQISIPTGDDGFVGRACDSQECGQYFKVLVGDHKDELFCPYCASRFCKNDLLTHDQETFLQEAVTEKARVYAETELDKMLKNLFGGTASTQSGVTYKPGRIVERRIPPGYRERQVDTELQCPACKTRFQVYGIFGFCPGCRAANLSIYDANWSIIKKEVDSADNPQRALRHAYSDLVSTFEIHCESKAGRFKAGSCNFQALCEARKFFKKHAGVDMLDGLGPSTLLALRRVFNKRHVYIHSGGRINKRYVKMIPEDSKLLGQPARLEFTELEEAADGMRSALAKLAKSIEEPG